jgi:hypothetical protein
MSDYTMELNEVLANSYNIFNFPYDIIAEYKTGFEGAFTKHFFYREIGFETPERFIAALEDKMATVFPYYNYLLKQKSLEYQILSNYALNDKTTTTREHSETLTDDTATTTQNDITNDTTETGNDTNNRTLHKADGTDTVSSTTTAKTVDTNEETVNTQDTQTTETADTNDSLTIDTDNKHVDSDVPNNIVSMTDIEGNVYASKAFIENNKQTNADTKHEDNVGTANVKGTNSNQANVKDNTTETGTISNDLTSDETEQNTLTKNEGSKSIINNDTAAQVKGTKTALATDTETVEHNITGNVGVQTDMDAMLNDFELQKVLQQVYLLFFNECEDLFMCLF